MNYIRGIKLQNAPKSPAYPFGLPVVKYLADVDALEFHKPVTFFIGENGSGKSTVLEAIAVAMGLNAEGGSRDFSFSTRDTHSELCDYITLIKSSTPQDSFFLRAESFYNAASYIDDNTSLKRYGGVSFHEQSHGESFLSLASNRFAGNGVYLLDEPEAALSPQRLMSLLVIINELVGRGSQFIISTHSPILMAYPDAEILQFSESGIEKTEYTDTEHYRITKQFIDSPERMMKYLFE